MVRADLQEEYEAIQKETKAQIHLFKEGGHPALYSNAEEAARIILEFLMEQ